MGKEETLKKKKAKKKLVKLIAKEARVPWYKAADALEVSRYAPLVLDQVIAGKISLRTAARIAAAVKDVRHNLQ